MIFFKDKGVLISTTPLDHGHINAMFYEFNAEKPGGPVDGQTNQALRTNLFQDEDEEQEIASIERYEVEAPLGSGTYGRVYLVWDREKCQYQAMKVIRKQDISRHDAHRHLANELIISQLKIDCPFVNNSAVVFEGPKHHFLISQLLEGGELYYLIREKGALGEPIARFYACEIMLALKALHSNRVLYRDLKPENILLHADGHIGLVDFGLSRPNFQLCDTSKTMCGTAEYVAPEMLVGDPYGFPIDAWGLGCVIYEMLVGTPPFYDTRPSVMNENIVFSSPKYPASLSPCVVGLMEGLLHKMQDKRLTIDEAMRHPWFTGVCWEAVMQKIPPPPFIPTPMQAVRNAVRKDVATQRGCSKDSFVQTP